MDKLQDFKDADNIPAWSRNSINSIVNNRLMGGYPDGTFKATKSITRAEAVVVLDRALNLELLATPVTPPPAFEVVKGNYER